MPALCHGEVQTRGAALVQRLIGRDGGGVLRTDWLEQLWEPDTSSLIHPGFTLDG